MAAGRSGRSWVSVACGQGRRSHRAWASGLSWTGRGVDDTRAVEVGACEDVLFSEFIKGASGVEVMVFEMVDAENAKIEVIFPRCGSCTRLPGTSGGSHPMGVSQGSCDEAP